MSIIGHLMVITAKRLKRMSIIAMATILQLQLGLELSLVGEDVINGHKKQLVVLSAIFCFNDQNAVKLP